MVKNNEIYTTQTQLNKTDLHKLVNKDENLIVLESQGALTSLIR